uniref:Uncharacterized protein n=1 Tax=Prevotella sp. GTC17259 TaxID=3236795 RepID=A0AB33IZK6_9BACT
MEQFKLDFFRKDHETVNINFITLSKKKCDDTFISFCTKYKIQENERTNIFNNIQNKGHYINFTNAEDAEFNLGRLINDLNIKTLPINLYVCWDSFYNIDVFKYDDAVKYFDYIWYPIVDDMIIFDSSFNLCLMIRHDGIIYTLN